MLTCFCQRRLVDNCSSNVAFLSPGADAINISGLLNPKKLGNFKNRILSIS